MIQNLINAVQFLTIFTISKKHKIVEGDLAKSMVHFPLVGFLIGFLLINADKIFFFMALPYPVANLLLIILSILITRALHLDGLADTLDGMMGGKSQNERLAIMKDSRIGTAGTIGIFLILFLKYVCLNALFNSDKTGALLTAPMLARWSQTILTYKANYGRQEGMARDFVGHLRTEGFVYASLVAVGFAAFVVIQIEIRTVFLIVSLIAGVVLFTLLGRQYLVRKLGGVTGDAIGAMSELNEGLVFLLFVVFSLGN
jgi:adenosylcobinamide-GDP ribazoletransferase